MKNIILILFLFITSCSSVKYFFTDSKVDKILKDYKKIDNRDYLMHLSNLGKYYQETPGIEIKKLSKTSKKYLRHLYNRLTHQSELIYKKKLEPEFFIIIDNAPFFFSLPNGQIFLSSRLISKYLKHEDILISVLSSEIFRIHHDIYEKKLIVSVGYIDTERILSILKLPEKTQAEVDKWAFYTMKRAGFDAIAYLNWLQIQNKNTMDFFYQHGGDTRRISREEFLFKKFIVTQGISSDDTKRFERRSSAGFYRLKKEINKRVKKWKNLKKTII